MVEISPLLIDTLNQLATDSNEMYLQHKDGVGGTWSFPPMVGLSWDGDLFDRESMAEAFDRSSIDLDYQLAIYTASNRAEPGDDDTERGTLADIAACQIQSGYLSQRERAFRARHTTPIQAMCHAAARRKGHGKNDGEEGGVFSCVLNSVFDIVNHGR
jgi:hypothetical protein